MTFLVIDGTRHKTWIHLHSVYSGQKGLPQGKAVNYFCKRLRLRCLTRLWIFVCTTYWKLNCSMNFISQVFDQRTIVYLERTFFFLKSFSQHIFVLFKSKKLFIFHSVRCISIIILLIITTEFWTITHHA